MTTERILIYGSCVVGIILLYYLFPFLSALWIGFIARRKGRKIGLVRQNKLSVLYQPELAKLQNPSQNAVPDKTFIAEYRKLISDNISAESARLEARYNPIIDELNNQLAALEAEKNKKLQAGTGPSIASKALNEGKTAIIEDIFDSGFWTVTVMVWGVILLLVLDTLISTAWIEEIGVFKKTQTIFSPEMVSRFHVLQTLNLTSNTIFSFLLNVTLVVILHVLLRDVDTPKLLEKPANRIYFGLAILATTILLRFLLPNSEEDVKGIFLIFIWLLLLATAFIVLALAFRQLKNNYKVLGSLLIILVIPSVIFAYLFGGFLGLLGKIADGLITSLFELRKARINQQKRNVESKMQNLEDGFYEGLTDEVRE